ncbi:hypothetical protein LTR62_004241 [Meristemomyces frigidus]|uniref:Uncharacterized protein n=1 Tax=Meristemomyces frigidus TaxID=1508187 RepID=A0AAN7YRG5_9PEZI|nr:hypothetical protein LTR62_004241 [Meristemomyces frigidus]
MTASKVSTQTRNGKKSSKESGENGKPSHHSPDTMSNTATAGNGSSRTSSSGQNDKTLAAVRMGIWEGLRDPHEQFKVNGNRT